MSGCGSENERMKERLRTKEWKCVGGIYNPARLLNIPNNKMPQTLTESMWGWAKNEKNEHLTEQLNE